MRIVSWILLAACRAPVIEDVPVQPCRITNRDKTVDFRYDAEGRMIAREERSKFTTSSTFVYDGDWLSEQTSTGTYGSPLVWRYERDAAGNHVATTIEVEGGKKPPDTTWRGEYEGKRLVRDFGVAGSMANYTDYRYDENGRVTRATSHLSISGTIASSYEYDDAMRCLRYSRPLDPPHEPVRPCPILIRTNDRLGRSETKLQYRNGRLVDDGAYVYVHDATGRLTRVQSIRMPERADVYVYECP